MQINTKKLASLLGAGLCAALVLGAMSTQAQDAKPDANGTWKWTGQGRGGNPGPEYTLKLKSDGSKLTGTISLPARGGGDPTDVDISNGKITGDQISFEYVREGNNGSVTNKYEGKISGDTITGTQPGRRGRGNRNGGGGGNGGGGNGGGGNGGGGNGGGNGGGGNGGGGMPAPTTQAWTATRSK